MTDFFKGIKPVTFKGPRSKDPLAFHHYNKDEIVLGKRMEDHIRPAVAYWHSFAWEGGDPFGGRTFDRPWFGKGMDGAKLKADVAFELFDILDIPFFCFHDADIAPEGATLAEDDLVLVVVMVGKWVLRARALERHGLYAFEKVSHLRASSMAG